MIRECLEHIPAGRSSRTDFARRNSQLTGAHFRSERATPWCIIDGTAGDCSRSEITRAGQADASAWRDARPNLRFQG